MKLRIRDNTIRLRLTQPEVTRFARTGRVEARTRFGPGVHEVLTYALERDPEAPALYARWQGGSVTVYLPAETADAWASTGVVDGPVGCEGTQDIGGGDLLLLLVEKDFACLDDRDPAEDAGAYPNPQAATGLC